MESNENTFNAFYHTLTQPSCDWMEKGFRLDNVTSLPAAKAFGIAANITARDYAEWCARDSSRAENSTFIEVKAIVGTPQSAVFVAFKDESLMKAFGQACLAADRNPASVILTQDNKGMHLTSYRDDALKR